MIENKALSCCDEQKIARIRVQTPQGEKEFLVCSIHRELEYFSKYLISVEVLA
jgi:hypothetical protein